MRRRDEDESVNITICGDGGCGKRILLLPLAIRNLPLINGASLTWEMSPGKSSITLRLVRSQWTNDYDPTIEDSYSVTRSLDGHTYHLQLTDTAGQEEYRGLFGASNLQSADAFLLVYDITSLASLHSLQHFAQLIDIEAEQRVDRGGIPPVKIVAGNKCDLKERREVRAQTGMEWARKNGCMFMETSAREKVNVEETFACE